MARKTDIRLRRSNTEAAIPTHTNLSDGELAMNTKDGALYFKKSDNTVITVHDDTIMHIDSSNRVVKLFETVKRDSNNTAYTTGDAAGFEYKEAVKIFSDSDEGVIDISRTISNGGNREIGARIRANGTSFFENRITIGGSSTSVCRLFLETPESNKFIIAKGSNASASSNQVLFTLDQVINSSTNTTSSGRIQLHTSTDGTQSTPISLSGDPDTDSLITGVLDVDGAFTASSVGSDTTVATGAFVLPNAAGTEGQVLQWPSSGTTLTWATDVDAVNAIGMARSLGWVPGNGHSTATAVVWNDSQSAVELKPSGSATTGIIHKAFRVYAGQKIHATIHIKPASTGAANGLYAFLYKHDGNLPAGKTHVGNGGTADAQVQAADSSQAFSTVNNLAPASGWNSYTTEYTPASDGYVSIALHTTTTIGTTSIYFKQPVVANAGIGIGDVIAIQYLLG